jgi:hypothetical protein
LPTVGRSLEHIAGAKSSSVSLSEKLKSLTAFHTTEIDDTGSDQVLPVGEETPSSSPITSRLWQHVQKALLARSTLPLQAFVTHDRGSIPPSEQHDILEIAGKDERLDGHDLLAVDEEELSGPLDFDTSQDASLLMHERGLRDLDEKIESAGSQAHRAADLHERTLLDPNPQAIINGYHDRNLDSAEVPEDNRRHHTSCGDSYTCACPRTLGIIASSITPIPRSEVQYSSKVAEVDRSLVEDLLFEDF